jgi:prohibitin 2
MDKEDMQIAVFGGVVMAFVLLAIASVFGYFVVTVVGPGETGVKFNLLADGVQDDEFGEGFHLKAPWVKVDKFNARTQEYTMTKVVYEGKVKSDDRIRTVTKEGLYVDLDITVLFRIVPDKADVIRQTLGNDGQYQAIVIRPTVRNAVREVISKYDAMDIYGEKRAAIEDEIYATMVAQLSPRDIIVEKLLIRDVGLPEDLARAIEAKKTSEQEALRMQYVLDKERLEKQRRIIEAEGISSANAIIAGSLTTEYLTWYWIDNLDTHNSVIYVPVGDAGLPLFREVSGKEPQVVMDKTE